MTEEMEFAREVWENTDVEDKADNDYVLIEQDDHRVTFIPEISYSASSSSKTSISIYISSSEPVDYGMYMKESYITFPVSAHLFYID